MPRQGLHCLVAALLVIAVLVGYAYGHARWEWLDHLQDVRFLPDGTVVVRDERTLVTDQDFGEA